MDREGLTWVLGWSLLGCGLAGSLRMGCEQGGNDWLGEKNWHLEYCMNGIQDRNLG